MSGARRLLLPVAARSALAQCAETAWPEECCGILVGRRRASETVIESVRATLNVSSGDRRRRFAIDPREVLAAAAQARAVGQEVVGFYHSHPASGAQPSRRDRANAWPEASCVIVSAAGEIASWWFPAEGPLVAEAIVDYRPPEVAS